MPVNSMYFPGDLVTVHVDTYAIIEWLPKVTIDAARSSEGIVLKGGTSLIVLESDKQTIHTNYIMCMQGSNIVYVYWTRLNMIN